MLASGNRQQFVRKAAQGGSEPNESCAPLVRPSVAHRRSASTTSASDYAKSQVLKGVEHLAHLAQRLLSARSPVSLLLPLA